MAKPVVAVIAFALSFQLLVEKSQGQAYLGYSTDPEYPEWSGTLTPFVASDVFLIAEDLPDISSWSAQMWSSSAELTIFDVDYWQVGPSSEAAFGTLAADLSTCSSPAPTQWLVHAKVVWLSFAPIPSELYICAWDHDSMSECPSEVGTYESCDGTTTAFSASHFCLSLSGHTEPCCDPEIENLVAVGGRRVGVALQAKLPVGITRQMVQGEEGCSLIGSYGSIELFELEFRWDISLASLEGFTLHPELSAIGWTHSVTPTDTGATARFEGPGWDDGALSPSFGTLDLRAGDTVGSTVVEVEWLQLHVFQDARNTNITSDGMIDVVAKVNAKLQSWSALKARF